MTALYYAARERWGSRCPCCDRPMRRLKPKRGSINPLDMETRGHDIAVALGGNPDVWVAICRRCNGDQGSLSFEVWARKLWNDGDRRSLPVMELSTFIRQWLEENCRNPVYQEAAE